VNPNINQVQELTERVQYAVTSRLAMFIDLPQRFLQPGNGNPNTAGSGDISFGFKYALYSDDRRILTFMLRTIAPTGDPREGLGTGNWWMEPGLLYLQQMSLRWQVFGELRGQFSLSNQSDFTGSLIRYGVGTSYVVCTSRLGYLAPVFETVGWTMTSGKEFAFPTGAVNAAGDTIVNAKMGLRIGLGAPVLGQPFPTRADLYVGYARAMTGAFWYKDMFQLQFRWFF
jgi:hypothetical protein